MSKKGVLKNLYDAFGGNMTKMKATFNHCGKNTTLLASRLLDANWDASNLTRATFNMQYKTKLMGKGKIIDQDDVEESLELLKSEDGEVIADERVTKLAQDYFFMKKSIESTGILKNGKFNDAILTDQYLCEYIIRSPTYFTKNAEAMRQKIQTLGTAFDEYIVDKHNMDRESPFIERNEKLIDFMVDVKLLKEKIEAEIDSTDLKPKKLDHIFNLTYDLYHELNKAVVECTKSHFDQPTRARSREI